MIQQYITHVCCVFVHIKLDIKVFRLGVLVYGNYIDGCIILHMFLFILQNIYDMTKNIIIYLRILEKKASRTCMYVCATLIIILIYIKSMAL